MQSNTIGRTEALVSGTAFRAIARDLHCRGISTLPIRPGTKKPGYLLLDNPQPYAWRDRIEALPDWQDVTDTCSHVVQAEVAVVLGSVSGGLVAVDFDYEPAPGVFERIIAVLPKCQIGKRGKKGFTLFYRSSDIVAKTKWTAPVTGVVVEVLTRGQYTIVPPSIHPETGEPYVWLDSEHTLVSQPIANLPELTLADLGKIDSVMVELGYTVVAEPARQSSPAGSFAVSVSNPWEQANTLAMSNLEAWVLQLPWPVTPERGRGYIKAVPFWRPNKDGLAPHRRNPALSFYPNGIRDNSSAASKVGYSPIDVVQHALGIADYQALEWLQDKLGIVPEEDSALTDEQVTAIDVMFAKAAEAGEPPAGQDAASSLQKAPMAAPDPFAGLPNAGLVGRLTDWISLTSRAPQPDLAMAAALTLVATVAGRRYMGPTEAGTALYMVGLAPSGAGKDRPIQAIKRLLIAAGLSDHIGSGDPRSAEAITTMLRENPLRVMPIDEFGSFWSEVNSPAMGWMKRISKDLRTLWSVNFDAHTTSAHSERKRAIIEAPHVSLFGASTPDEFWSALTSGETKNGVLNRFLIVQSDYVAEPQEAADGRNVPEDIIAGLRAVYGAVGDSETTVAIAMTARSNPTTLAPLVHVGWTESARARFREAEKLMKVKRDANPEVSEFYGRAAEMALRVATVMASGINPAAPIIDLVTLDWSISLVSKSLKVTVAKAADFIADTPAQANAKKVLRVVRDAGGTISRQTLTKRLQHSLKAFELKDVMSLLLEAGDLVEIAGARAANGKAPVTYQIGIG